jgi:uncharacterized membrane protein
MCLTGVVAVIRLWASLFAMAFDAEVNSKAATAGTVLATVFVGGGCVLLLWLQYGAMFGRSSTKALLVGLVAFVGVVLQCALLVANRFAAQSWPDGLLRDDLMYVLAKLGWALALSILSLIMFRWSLSCSREEQGLKPPTEDAEPSDRK